jgi:hypothetical protein
VEGKQAEEVHQNLERVVVDLAFLLDLLERREVGLDNHPLCVCLGKAVEVDKKVVPCLLLLVTVFAGLKGQERDAPCECGDEVLVGADDVESTADVAAVLEVFEDGGGVIGRLVAVEDGTGGFEELRMRQYCVEVKILLSLHNVRLAVSTCSCHPPM